MNLNFILRRLRKCIGHNGFHYQFVYDGYGNITETSIAGNKVIRYIYEDDNGKLYKIIYGNGHEIRYVYDELRMRI